MILVPRTAELTEYSCPLASARKIVGIGAPGGMTKVVFRPSSEIDTGAKSVYTGSGTGRFIPQEWDYIFGEAFELPRMEERPHS